MNTPRPIQQTREQERAKQAWDAVSTVTVAARDKYGANARRLPALIQYNGLGQTLAFLRSKPDNAGMRLLYGHLSAWVTAQITPGQTDLLQAVLNWDSDTYRRAATEAVAYALWLRRFVEAEGWGESEEASA